VETVSSISIYPRGTVCHHKPDKIPVRAAEREIRVSWLNTCYNECWSFQQIKNTLGKPYPHPPSPKTWMRWWERNPDKGNQTPAGCDLFARSRDSWVYTCKPQWEVEMVFCLMWVKNKAQHCELSQPCLWTITLCDQCLWNVKISSLHDRCWAWLAMLNLIKSECSFSIDGRA